MHSSKEPINVVVVSVDLILRNVFSGFAGYENQFHDEIKDLLIKTPKLNRSIKSLEKDSNTLNKYSETRNTITGVTRKGFDVDTIHKNKYITTVIKFYKIWIKRFSMTKDYHKNKLHVTYLLILIDSVDKSDKILKHC